MTESHAVSVRPTASLRDVMVAINAGALGLCTVTDESGKLIGLISDGDLRRGLLRGLDLQARAADVMNRAFAYLEEGRTRGEALDLMERLSIRHVPVLDHRGRMVGLHWRGSSPPLEGLPNWTIVMAGGQGMRLRPHTTHVPKPMIQIAGLPILEHVLLACMKAGLSRFLISVHYLREQIIEYFGDGSHWGIDVRYLEEEQPLGTAGSLSLVEVDLHHPVLVLNGDVLTRVDFRDMLVSHNTSIADASLCVRYQEIQSQFGVVRMRGGYVVELEEKPIEIQPVNAGIYVLSPSVVSRVPRGTRMDMTDLLMSLINQGGRVAAFPIHEYWRDIGQPDSLQQAHKEWT